MTYPKVSTDPAAPSDPRDGQGGVPSTPRFPQIEERVLAYWEADDTFRASVEQRDAGEDGANEFVFYDGPPFANGLPHYGHLLTGYVKDLIPRYQTMRGRRVERRFGWDTHGLPAELEAMRQLGIKTTDEILEMGIETFNAECRKSVFEYTDEWRDYVTRQARWVDFDHDYKTLDLDYMESVMWAFQQLWEKGLAYEGFRVLPYCWNDETPLSNHELRMDEDVYQMRQDPAVTVGCGSRAGRPRAPGPDLDDDAVDPVRQPRDHGRPRHRVRRRRVDVHGAPERYLVAAARLAAYARELAPKGTAPEIVARFTGADLLGSTYAPPFSYYLGHARAYRLVEARLRHATEGTGLVHTAGAFGEEDKVVTDREGIEPVVPVAKDGRFTPPVDDYAGMHVFDANLAIIDHLKNMTRGDGDTGSVTPGTVLLRRESYEHSYPHCWRCREPLIYMAVSSWFVRTTKIRDRMLDLNQQIRWVPEHIKDGQFGRWLENTRDWSISRNRFWGSPIPVWKSDDPAYPRIDVYGSLDELERDFGVRPKDLHRPFIDELTRPNPDDPTGRSTMRRVTDVMDCWFESGSMSFAQVHYPFDNADWFEHHFPGDFIVEYIGQTRGWFYTMHVLASAIFDRPAFETCLSHGIVLGSDGQKMSKSLRNYPDVREVFDRDGADAMRWFLMSSPILRGGNLIVTEQGIREGVRQVLIPLWNSWYFFALYANAVRAGYDAQRSTTSTHPMDRYLLAKAEAVRRDDDPAAGRLRGRQRLRHDPGLPRRAVELVHPPLPGALLGGRGRRRHRRVRHALHGARDRVPGRRAAAAADDRGGLARADRRALGAPHRLAVRRRPAGRRRAGRGDGPGPRRLLGRLRAAQGRGLRNRLPLSDADGRGRRGRPADGLRGDRRRRAQRQVGPAARRRPPRGGVVRRLAAAHRQRPRRRPAARQGRADRDQGLEVRRLVGLRERQVTAGGLVLQEGEFTLETVAAGGDGSATGMLPGGGFVVLDTAVTPELEAEGVARDLVRAVQQARRDAGLDVSDRIALTVVAAPAVADAARTHAT